MALVMPLSFYVMFLVLEDPLKALPGEVENVHGRSSKNGPVLVKIPLSEWNICCRQLPPLIGKLIRTGLVPPGLELSYQLAQSFHTKVVLKDLIHVRAEEEVDLVLYVAQMCSSMVFILIMLMSCHLFSDLISNTCKECRGLRWMTGILKVSSIVTPVANHEVPVSGLQKV